VENKNIGKRTENKYITMERDRIKVEERIMVVDNIILKGGQIIRT
jgi:hypothetical protein